MNVVNQRVANFIKSFSMFAVIGSLLYMYGYVPENGNVGQFSQNWILQLPKAQLFYSGLLAFAVSDLVMIFAIGTYKQAKGVHPKSIVFRSKEQKESRTTW